MHFLYVRVYVVILDDATFVLGCVAGSARVAAAYRRASKLYKFGFDAFCFENLQDTFKQQSGVAVFS
jgi:hypothetical protein